LSDVDSLLTSWHKKLQNDATSNVNWISGGVNVAGIRAFLDDE
jgi:hypothetical protein